jgi:hypothetical protein
MNNAKYIELVKEALDTAKDKVGCIAKISALSLPANADPLIVLIHGDSQQLQSAVSYAKNNDPASPDDDEIKELGADLSDEIIQKLKRYLADWDSGNMYHYRFNLKATYGAFTNEHGDVEYIEICKYDDGIKTIKEAIQSAKEWQARLSERIKLYSDQEIGHKLISVKPTYVIRDKNLQKVASGTLQGNDEFGISTWLNQD